MIPSGNLGGFYFLLNEGGISYSSGILGLRAGRFRNYDEVNSPYSLFINSTGISANSLRIRLESDHWLYQSMWIEATSRNSVSSPAWNEYARRLAAIDPGHFNEGTYPNFYKPSVYYDPSNPLYDPSNTTGLRNFGFPDRGVNYKIYALKVDDWRLGFLDAAVYTGRLFDFEYFLNPLPQYFIQYAKKTAGRPWATETNENNLIGLFWDIKKDDNWSAYAQVLVDDISFGWAKFLFDGFSENPWKAAWALGGTKNTSIGRFGFHHGGALKYTFEPVGTDDYGPYGGDSAATAYGYTYYPETRYYDGSETVNLLIQDNMIGYKHGENNLAFQVDYQNTFFRFLVTAELEFVLAGPNSPANPWHDYEARASMYADGKEGSHLLDSGVMEKRLEFRLNVSRKIGPVKFFAAFALGGRFNKLELRPADDDPFIQLPNYVASPEKTTVDDDIWIWKPSNKHEFFFRLSVGFRYTLGVL
jgi:hypothetical protein